MKGKDGEIKTRKFNSKPKILFRDELEYIKQKRALGRYLKTSYKYLLFTISPILKKPNKSDGTYIVDLKADDIFCKVYGDVKLIYSVKNDIAIIEDIEPKQFLLDGYFQDLEVYKGIPYRDEKDLFKIKLIIGEQNGSKEI